MHNTPFSGQDEPVTVIVTRTAKKGKVQEFEEWMDGIIHVAMRFEGHMGVNVIRPQDPSRPEYVIIFRFNTYGNLQKWEKSQERKEWIEKSKDVIEGEPKVEMQSGLEFWFTPHGRSSPPRYKMAIVTAAIISVLLTTLIPVIQQVTEGLLPFLPRTLLVVAIMVTLMTYIVMPSVTRALSPWLSKKTLL